MRRRRSSYSRFDRDDNYGYWPKSLTVSERQAGAAREMTKLAKKGEALAPVRIEGRTIARTFWGKAWCTNLESYSDYSNRLPRGRSYLSSGQVLDLRIEKGKVVARVMGSSLYTVTVSIDPVAPDQWKNIVRSCSGQVASMIELLQGRLSESVMQTVTRQRTGLFPAPAEIHLRCSCPDWASMCKHVAASLYGVGARLDVSPELLFLLRGVEATELVVDSGAARAITGQAKGKALGAQADELAGLFGIDLADTPTESAPTDRTTEPVAPAGAAPKSPRPKSGARRRKVVTASDAAEAKSAVPAQTPRKIPVRTKAARAPKAPAPAQRSSKKPARPGEGVLVTQKELDGRDIDASILDYWVSARLLVPGPKTGTWLATPEAQRRIARCPMRSPRNRKR